MSPISLDIGRSSWPQPNATLFSSEGPPEQLARIGWGGTDHQYVLYIHGYKDAADDLVRQSVMSKSVEQLDTYALPIVFMYRQFIELRLKWLFLVHGKRTREDKRKSIKNAGHNLYRIWKEVRLIIEESLAKVRKDCDAVEGYIKQFDKMDKESSSFRYPINTNLDPNFDAEKRINLSVLSERIEELEAFFLGVDCKLELAEDWEHDGV